MTNRTLLRVLIPMAVLLGGCSVIAPPSPFPTDSPAASLDAATRSPTITPPPTVQVLPSATPPPTARPEGEGWLLFSTSSDGVTIQNLYAASADGTEVRPLVTGEQIVVPWDWDLTAAVSPDGRYLAYITTTDPNLLHGLTLHLLSLPEGEVRTITRLAAPEVEPSEPGGVGFDVVRALSEVNSLAWSPDGTRLAFMGAIEGPSSDLYVYSLADGSIARLTDGSSQSIRPIWSPDGRDIVHAGVSSLGTGAGFGMEGVWSAAADGSGVRVLYEPDSGDEEWLGWVDDRTLVLYSWSAFCGPNNLRQLNIDTGEVRVLFSSHFLGAVYDPDSRTALVTLDQYIAACSREARPGVYLISAGGEVSQVEASDSYEPYFARAARAFYVMTSGRGVLEISVDGNVRETPYPAFTPPSVSPGGDYWLWNAALPSESGLWIGPYGLPPAQLVREPVQYAAWHPDGNRLAFFSEGALYMAAVPDFTPTLVGSDLPVTNWPPVWVMP